jgi:penicillin amidase
LTAFRLHRKPAQNIVYADVDGNIGYLLAADIPVRAKGDGTMPVPGWTGEYEWTGYVPFSRLPQTVNPPEEFIVTANNKPVGDEYPYPIGSHYAAPYRATRIIQMLKSKSKHSAEDMAEMQTDVTALHAREIMPMLLATKPASEQEKKALALLSNWDLRVTVESPAAAVFEAWYTALGRRLFADELGEALWDSYSTNIYMVGMALPEALRGDTSFCDDVRTSAKETCSASIAAALADGLKQMTQAQGSADVLTWRWGAVHFAHFPHSPFDKDPNLQNLFSRKVPHAGDKHTVNVGSTFLWETYDQLHGAIYRQIIDFSDAGKSRFITTPGQSGDPHSPHYDDLLPRWQRGEYLPILYNRTAVDRETAARIVLQP